MRYVGSASTSGRMDEALVVECSVHNKVLEQVVEVGDGETCSLISL